MADIDEKLKLIHSIMKQFDLNRKKLVDHFDKMEVKNEERFDKIEKNIVRLQIKIQNIEAMMEKMEEKDKENITDHSELMKLISKTDKGWNDYKERMALMYKTILGFMGAVMALAGFIKFFMGKV